MFPVYCRITGGSKPFQSHHLLYFPILPPISNEDAQRICRITGKAFNLTKHSFVPTYHKKNGEPRRKSSTTGPKETNSVKNKRVNHKSKESTSATATGTDSSKDFNSKTSTTTTVTGTSASGSINSQVQSGNKLLENEEVLTCIINIKGKNVGELNSGKETGSESPILASSSSKISTTILREEKQSTLIEGGPKGGPGVKMNAGQSSLDKIAFPITETDIRKDRSKLTIMGSSSKRDSETIFLDELTTPILQNMEDIEKFKEQLLSEPDLDSGKWICNEWIPGQYVETVEYGRKFIPGEFIKTKYNELKFVPARVTINEFNQVEYKPGEIFETPEGELYYIAQDLKVSNAINDENNGPDGGQCKLEFTLQCFDNDNVSDTASDLSGVNKMDQDLDEIEEQTQTTRNLKPPRSTPKLKREESIILEYEVNNGQNELTQKGIFNEDEEVPIEAKISSTEELLKETIELAIRMNKRNIANELQQIASSSINEIINDEEIIEILNQLKQLDKSNLIGEMRESKSCKVVKKHNLLSFNLEESSSDIEEHSIQEVKGGRGGDQLVEITEVTTPDIDEVSSKRFRLDFDDILSSVEPMLDNSLAMHKISIRPKKTRQITTSITTIGMDEETIMDATTAQIVKEATLSELIETEEEFVRDLKYIMTNYYDALFDANLSTSPSELVEAREVIFGNLKLIYEFHDGVLLEGLKYYSKEPKMIGRTFIRLVQDFSLLELNLRQ